MNSLEFGNVIYVSDDKLMCQVFPEGIKQSMAYVCVLTDKVLCFPDNTTSLNADILSKVCDTITDNNRIIPLEDIERVVYPTEDVKIVLFLKRKGNRNMRIYRKSTGKYCDVCIGKPEDTKKVYDLLMSQLG